MAIVLHTSGEQVNSHSDSHDNSTINIVERMLDISKMTCPVGIMLYLLTWVWT